MYTIFPKRGGCLCGPSFHLRLAVAAAGRSCLSACPRPDGAGPGEHHVALCLKSCLFAAGPAAKPGHRVRLLYSAGGPACGRATDVHGLSLPRFGQPV